MGIVRNNFTRIKPFNIIATEQNQYYHSRSSLACLPYSKVTL